MSEPLLPDGSPVITGGVTVTAHGLSGEVRVHLPFDGTLRGAEDTRPAFVEALAATGFVEQLTVEIADPADHPAYAPAGTRGAPAGPSELAVTVPGPGEDFGQVLLACDEDGVLTWHFPEDVPPAETAQRAAEPRTYRIRTRAISPEDGGKRGVMGALGKKLLKVLAFRLVDRALGAVGDFFVSAWERKHRPHYLRPFGPDSYRQGPAAPLSPAELAALGGGPALAFIHGTASQGHKAFGALPRDLMQLLSERYGGRVLAFEHPTLSVTPLDNVTWLAGLLAEQLPAGRGLEVDVVAHSRGGLVARVLCERAAEAGLDPGRLKVCRAVLVATPNSGTPLADRKHLNAFIDTLTNLLEFFPDNPATDTLEILLTLLKQVAVGAMGGLDGLMSMNPQGAFLRDVLNRPGAASTAAYRALAANYEPPPGAAIGRYARDHLTDLVFTLQANDLVVPTAGVYAANGAGSFPIADPVVFAAGEGVDHSGFWTRPVTREALGAWLTG